MKDFDDLETVSDCTQDSDALSDDSDHMQGRRKIDNWGAYIHIFVFTDCKNN